MIEKNNQQDSERSERLFEILAAEEPPLDLQNDTAPSKTAPRPAVLGERSKGRGGRLPLLIGIGLLLLVTLGVTIMIFSSEPEDSPSENRKTTPVNIVENPTSILPTPVPTEIRVTQTAPIVASPTVISPETEMVLQEILPTAAVDEVAVALSQPPLQVAEGISVNREVAPFTITGQTGRLEVITYTVQQGDTLSRIGETFNLDMCTLVWSNPRNRVSPLRPGNILNILPVDGVFFKVIEPITIQQVAEQTKVSPYTIIDSPYNKLFGLSPETVLVEGMKIVVPEGSGGDCNIWTAPTVSAGGSGASDGSVGGGGPTGGSLWGCTYSGGAGGFPANNPIGGSYKFWQGFSSGHTGVDLSASTGTPVLAAGAGTVAFAGWTDGGYGNAVIIDHGGSYSLYAHMSSINVQCGQAVGAQEVIGGVGSTGRSSGSHLHFEIRDAGFNPIDPVYSISGGL